MFVHTFNKLVPPEQYFVAHPEYFSEIQGQHLDNQQLCLTNEDVFKLVVSGLRERMAKRPDAPLWSVSQNDCFGPCECTDCQALVDKHGGQAGPLIVFLNRVAAKFPDQTISTLAYQYTRHAPKDLVPAPNVNICLCSIECDRAEPLGEGQRDADFRRDVREWSALTSNLMHERLLASGSTLSIYGSPAVQSETWLTPETLLAADQILAKAEQAVADRPEVLARVKDVRLSLIYARLEQAKRRGYGEYGLFERSTDDGWKVKAEWVELLDQFVAGCNAGGFKNVHERKSPPDEYAAQIRVFFSEGMVTHLAVGRPVTLTEPLNPKYPADGIKTLMDGIKGTTDYRFNWLGWEAVDTTVTVDLGETKEVRRVAADFLQVVISWIWMPTEVRWSTSPDGKTWEAAGVIRTTTPNTEKALLTERFETSFPARQVRYVRMEVTGVKHCPSWHHAAGGDAWFFCDEVMVFER